MIDGEKLVNPVADVDRMTHNHVKLNLVYETALLQM